MRERVSLRSLRTKIIVVFVACLLAAITAVYISDSTFISALVDENSNLAAELSTQELADDIDSKMQAIRQSTDAMHQYAEDMLHKNPGLLENSKDTDTFLELLEAYTLNEAKSTYGAIAAYCALNPETYGNKRGFFLMRPSSEGDFKKTTVTDLSAFEPDDIEHVGWYYVPIAEGKPTWMQPYQNKNVDVWMISYAIPLFTDDGDALGVLGMDLDFDPIIDSISQGYIYSSNGSSVLFDSDGEVIYRKGYEVDDPMPEGSGDASALWAATCESVRQDTAIDADWGNGVDRILARQLENGMTLATIVPRSDMMAPLQNRLGIGAAIAIVVALIATGLIVLLVRTITRPLRNLSKAATEISTGNMDVQITVEGDEEVRTLARAFQTMVHELQLRINHIQSMALIDSLTGLGSRAAYAAAAEALKTEMEQGSADFTFVLVDVNYLKRANDDYGHNAGDALLQDAARICMEVFGEGRVFRYGGDEYAAIVPDSSNVPVSSWPEKLNALTDSFNKNQQNSEGSYTRPYRCALSIACGAVVFDPAVHKTIEDVFSRADELMYECKREQKSARE